MSASRSVCRALPLAALLLGLVAPALAGDEDLPLLDYRTSSWFLPQTPGVTAGPVGGLFNPGAAALSDRGGFDLWSANADGASGLDNFGFGFGRNLNLTMNRQTVAWDGREVRVEDWQLGFAGGSRAGAFGVGYRWSGGDDDGPPRHRALVLGAVGRPGRGVSIGAARAMSLEADAAQNVFDLGLRPFASSALTLFADWTVDDDQRFLGDGTWGAGFEVRPVKGVHVGLRARERSGSGDVDYSVMVGLTASGSQGMGMVLFDRDGDQLRDSYLVRESPAHSGLAFDGHWFDKRPRYFAVNLENKVLTYQKYRLFDDKRVAWLDLLKLLNGLRDDDDIDFVALNLAGFRARPSLTWELRTKLQELRDRGKKIHIYIDNVEMAGYYLATVADRLLVDPQGVISIPGVTLTRSYLKGTLEKLGVGFQEHRYYKYKSAAETLSRDSMSAADREQRARVADVIYQTLRDGMASGRAQAAPAIDTAIDDLALVTPAEAVATGLVDGTGRWADLTKSLRKDHKATQAAVPESVRRTFWDDQWGQPPRIPVVFAVGECAMDSGIKGRTTSAYLRRLARDPNVAAVVLRADSPGGEPLPSDLVAEAVRQLKAAGKPVVVSQGDLAASGGYWISMDGSRILTTPLTITGSIGVISGWVWDDGIAGKAGITAEDVHRGRHADLFSSVQLPFLGSLPRRAMDQSELDRVETIIRELYAGFVTAVAIGRNLPSDEVERIAQGRVWMGGDAVELGLCDGFGGLDDAIAEARRLAGIPADRHVELSEYPPRPWIRWPSFGPNLPGLFGVGDRVNRWLGGLATATTADAAPVADWAPWQVLGLSDLESCYLQNLAHAPGQPQLLVAPDMVPDVWRDLD